MRTRLIPTYLDLFSGCGGLSLGFRHAGFHPLLAIDVDPQAVETYNFNYHGDGAGAVIADIGALKTYAAVAAFLDEHGISAGDCDVLVGGPPCQSFSMVGRTKVRALMDSDEKWAEIWQKKNATRTMLFEAYVLFLEYLQPRWFLFENVPAIRSHAAFKHIKKRFAELHTPSGERLMYDISPDVYWASEYGVPQHRRRFIMIGHRRDVGIEQWVRPESKPAPTVSEALGDLPRVEHGNKVREMPYSSPASSDYQRLMRQRPPEVTNITVFDHIGRRHNADDVALFGQMEEGAKFSDEAVQKALVGINPEHKLLKYSTEKFKDKLHKLHSQRPSWTVTAHLQKDCYKFIHHEQPRTITVREAARLQSFPDCFYFPTAMGSAYRLIGNAIPPLLAEAFAQSFCASDPGLTSINERVRAIVTDGEWEAISAAVWPAKLNSQGLWRVRAALAAGKLVHQEHRSWTDAARLLGERNPVRLQNWFGRTRASGLWYRAQPMLTPRVLPGCDENLELALQEAPMAAD
jgi:DNA (cytosine-5)-methyltransferase 1